MPRPHPPAKYRKVLVLLVSLLILMQASAVLAQHQELPDAGQGKIQVEADHGVDTGHSDLGKKLPFWSIIPFAGILLSIAIFPLVKPHFWHHHFGKVSAFWALLFAIPFVLAYQGDALYEILHIYLMDYIPFIILLWALFTVAGGILVGGAPVGTPLANLLLLLIGTFLASWIGTTGAAMVLIRPLIRMNKFRRSKIHLVVFFIFLVANIGGSLTPLGDPPLFLGFLHHVPFFWTFNLFTEMAMLAGSLLLLFFIFDSVMYQREGWPSKLKLGHHHIKMAHGLDSIEILEEYEMKHSGSKMQTREARLTISGLHNIFFLLGIIAGVLFSGLVQLGQVSIFGVHVTIQSIIRDVFLILMGLLSLKTTAQVIRKGNEFSWFPIVEVAKLFAGIFMTIIPALAMLKAGEEGHLNFIIEAVKEPWHYFWVTGSLSSFLDNAPTYLTFMNTALGQFFAGIPEPLAVARLIAEQEIYLKAISTGAVFFGAMTYIGNAPNFMVKSIAEEQNIKMPSFFGYMIYSVLLLVPLFVLVTFIFFGF
ncbi:MAG: sodium:proton antiporter [Calditrichia bacterium]